MAVFKLQPNPTFWATCPIPIPGEATPAPLELEFKHLGVDGLMAFSERAIGRTNLDVISEIVVGWRGVDAEYSPDNLAALLDNYPGAAGVILDTFRAEATGARAKN